MSTSTKFKILFDLYQHGELKDYLVSFKYMDEVKEDFFCPGKDYILRSALKSETPEQLNSGIGHSIEMLKNYKEFLAAKEIISKQTSLDFAILQPYWRFEKHITLLWDGEIYYGDVMGKSSEFIMVGPTTATGDKDILSALNYFIKKLKKYVTGPLILELGYALGELKLFQASEVKNESVKHFIFHELFIKAAQVQKEFLKNSFWKNLKIEFRAKKFRKLNPKFSLSNVLENWLYLFHYYKIFCIRNKMNIGNQSFEKFLNSINPNDFILSLAKWHISKANKYREDEEIPETASYFDTDGVIYLGKGVKQYQLGDNAICLEYLSANQILKHKDKLILSTYNAILGHPCLLMAQEGIHFVGGLKASEINSFKVGDEISVDFNLRKLEVKSQ